MKLTDQIQKSVPYQYAIDVLEGNIIAGDAIKMAAQRFFDWIDNSGAHGFYLDHAKGMEVINFFPTLLNHTKGRLAGQSFHLAPFQQFTMYNVFAWMDPSGKRRINTVYDKRAKKNGKSAEMAGVGLYGMSFEMESEAEIYVGATKEEQAKICWKQARSFIESPNANPLIHKLGFYCKQKEILNLNTGSVMKPLGGDSKTQDGINSHISIIDEYHAHASDAVKENLESSSVQRRQPITWHITTAGTNLASVCLEYEKTMYDILRQTFSDDHLWIMIHDLDRKDDWEDPKNWGKANPLLGQGLDIEALEKEMTKAKNQPSKIPNFKTKHLNMWVDAPTVWIPREIWNQNKVEEIPENIFSDFGCFGGVDLSTTTDITAVVFVSNPDEEDQRYIKPFFFCPKDTIERRSKMDRVPYRSWVDAGYLIATDGNTVDYTKVKELISSEFYKLNCNRVEFDQWNANQMATELIEIGLECSFFSQQIATISAPTKRFEKLVYDGKLLHDGNPIMTWMLSGCVIYEDANENKKVHKGQSNRGNKRVDGIVAAIMALGGSMSDEPEVKSKYEEMDLEQYKKQHS